MVNPIPLPTGYEFELDPTEPLQPTTISQALAHGFYSAIAKATNLNELAQIASLASQFQDIDVMTALLAKQWNEEFKATGLKKLSNVIGGAPAIERDQASPAGRPLESQLVQ